MSAQHTPGPWRVLQVRGGHEIRIGFGVVGNWLASVWMDEDVEVDEIAEADARLIAAAPELLAALGFVTSCLIKELGNLADEDELADEDAPDVLGEGYAKQVVAARLRIRQAKSAIAKATGAA